MSRFRLDITMVTVRGVPQSGFLSQSRTHYLSARLIAARRTLATTGTGEPSTKANRSTIPGSRLRAGMFSSFAEPGTGA